MSIQVVCPNGHVLKVANEYAGKTGLCPVCKSRVRVPKAAAEEQLSDEAIMDILGRYDPSKAKRKLNDVSDLAAADAPRALKRQASGSEDKVLAAGPVPPKMSCPHCNREVAVGIRICPHCNTYIARLDDF